MFQEQLIGSGEKGRQQLLEEIEIMKVGPLLCLEYLEDLGH